MACMLTGASMKACRLRDENIERVEALLRLLADHLAGDPACAEASRLMRLPGSHNTKDGAWTEAQILVNEPARRYEIDDLADWLETASPIIHRKPTTRRQWSRH